MRRTKSWTAAALAVTWLAVAEGGPDFDEPFDAGKDAAGAIPVTGPAGQNVAKIKGELEGLAFAGGGDFQDVYVIEIDDPSSFLADVEAPTRFDTELFLFFMGGGPGEALGLLGNDDTSTGDPLSILRSVATDGSGAAVVTPGRYYLAISGHDSNPVTSLGFQIFDQVSDTEISGPDGPGGSGFFVDWIPPTHNETGLYTIELTGVVFIFCPGDFDQDTVVGFSDLLSLLAVWGPCVGCPQDLDGTGVVDFADLLLLLSLWGPCPY